MKTYEQIVKEKVELDKSLRRTKRIYSKRSKASKRELAVMILVMSLFFGYLMWQVNRNMEKQYIEVYRPVEVVKTRYVTVQNENVQTPQEELLTNKRPDLTDKRYESLPLPSQATGSFKTYMDYRAITNKTSKQWNLQQLAKTNEEGFRVFNGAYLVALGSAYASEIGDTFKITTSEGISFLAMAGDFKKDIHTDETNRYMKENGNIVEFIVDTEVLSKEAIKAGDVSVAGFNGAITKIEKITN